MLTINRFRVKSGWLLVVAAGSVGLGVCGCSSSQPQIGDKKEDWKKTAPPPQYRGPGQPGGPPTGAASGPATPVPAGAGNK